MKKFNLIVSSFVCCFLFAGSLTLSAAPDKCRRYKMQLSQYKQFIAVSHKILKAKKKELRKYKNCKTKKCNRKIIVIMAEINAHKQKIKSYDRKYRKLYKFYQNNCSNGEKDYTKDKENKAVKSGNADYSGSGSKEKTPRKKLKKTRSW